MIDTNLLVSQHHSLIAMSVPVAILKSRLRSHYPFFLAYRLRWADNDQYGHVNNSVYNYLCVSSRPS